MRKIWTIARREYGAMVATKAFLISITLMPVLMFGGIFVANRLKDVRDVDDKVVVVIDGSGALLDDLQKAAEARNASLQGPDGKPTAPPIVLKAHASPTVDDQERLRLSNQAREGEIDAFAEIPANILSTSASHEDRLVRYHAQNAMLSDERRWLEGALNEIATTRRLAEFEIDPVAVKRATAPIDTSPLGLFKETEEGKAGGAEGAGGVAGIFVPLGFLMLMFMVLVLSAQPMLESVIEEKSQRIAEVLLGSANPFQIMAGKLLGNVAGSLSIVALYGLGAYAAARHYGWDEFIPFHLAPWFIIYQIFAVMLFSSIFMAVGTAVDQLKDAQSLLLPVWVLAAMPLMVWLQIVRDPNGPIAFWMSFFPTATPMVMVLRLAADAPVPMWQILVGMAGLVATTAAVLFIAGRIFRVGILWQGKTPKVSELARWALHG